MAEVFRAKPFNTPDFHGFLALKRILPHLAEDDEFITMFIDEARLSVHLQHPNIVRIYELGQFQTSYYILMEFIAGKDLLTLQKRVRKRKEVIGVGNSALIARDMARGLDFAHKKTDEQGMPLNIIHRDVSPQNVLVDYLGDVKVIDFGIAKAAVQSSRTQVGVLKGKMGYMSPEQVQGFTLDARSDQFAIGAVLWEMLTNRRLFHGENEFETMRLVKACEVPAPSELNPEIPQELDQIVLKALAPDREHRYPCAGEFADALTHFLQKEGTTADHLSLWMREVFAEDLVEELSKRDQFASIVTADDVRRLSMGDSAGLEEPSDVWAGQQPNVPVDDLAFAAQHTMIQEGGFDPLMIEVTETEERLRKRPPPLPPSVTGQHPAMPLVSQRVENFHAEGTRPNIIAPSKSSKPIVMGVVALVAIVAVLVLGTAVTIQTMSKDKPSLSGTLIVNVNPSEKIEVFLNGESRGAEVPMTIENLGVGTHFVEVRAEGFGSQRIPVEVKANAVIPLAIQLKAAGPVMGEVAAKFPDVPDMRVFLNGKEKNPDDLQPKFEVPKGTHLLEVVAAGYRPWREFLEVSPGETTRLTPRLEPVGFSLRVEGEPNAVVRFAGQRVGIVPTTLENVDLRELHELEVSIRGEGISRWVTYVGLPLLDEGKVTVSFDRPPKSARKRDFGSLTIETGNDWWNIWVDNIDTGLSTPIDASKPLWLPVGKRKVSLRRGYQQHDFEVDVTSSGVTTLSEALPFTWDE